MRKTFPKAKICFYKNGNLMTYHVKTSSARTNFSRGHAPAAKTHEISLIKSLHCIRHSQMLKMWSWARCGTCHQIACCMHLKPNIYNIIVPKFLACLIQAGMLYNKFHDCVAYFTVVSCEPIKNKLLNVCTFFPAAAWRRKQFVGVIKDFKVIRNFAPVLKKHGLHFLHPFISHP